jgi:hypothetical protein
LPDQGDFHWDLNSQRANRLVMLMTGKQRYYQDPGDPYGQQPTGADISPKLDTPSNGILGLVIEDCAQFPAVSRGDVILPTIRAIEGASASKVFGIEATTPTGANDVISARWQALDTSVPMGSAGAIVIDPSYAGKQLFAKLKIEAKVTSGYFVAFIICRNLQEVNAQVMQSGEAENVVPVMQTPDKWTSGQPYVVDDIVSFSSQWWICVANVTSATDPQSDGAHWDFYADQTGFKTAYICPVFVAVNAPDDNVKSTTWIALPNFRDLNGCLGELVLGVFVGGGSGPEGSLNRAGWQLGVLEA